MAFRLLTAASAAALFAGAAQADTVLHILHTNDLHSRIEAINEFDSTCDAETTAAGECFGGVARVAEELAGFPDHHPGHGGGLELLGLDGYLVEALGL